MDTNLDDALSGLLLLGSDSNNDSDDGSTTCITNDSDVTPTSSNGGLTLGMVRWHDGLGTGPIARRAWDGPMARWAWDGPNNSTGLGFPNSSIFTGSRLPDMTAQWAPDGHDSLVSGWARRAWDCPTARWAWDGPDVRRLNGLMTARRSKGLMGSGQLNGLNGLNLKSVLDSLGVLNSTGLTQQA
jgi:hypothetical protein